MVYDDLGRVSSSDMLIIRHGRSRVRHSTQKNHIRWGLRAFDNLTLDYDYDNDTMDATGNQSSLYVPAGSDVFYVNGSVSGGGGGGSGERYSSSYSTPASTTDEQIKRSKSARIEFSQLAFTSTTNQPRKKIKKKQIMANIQKNVDKGVEYLKSHAHLLEENVEINSMSPMILGRNYGGFKSKDNKIQLPDTDEDITTTGTTFASSLSLSPMPLPPSSTVYDHENHIQNDDSLAAADPNNRREEDYISKTLSSSYDAMPAALYTTDDEKNQFSTKNTEDDKTYSPSSSPVVVEFNKQLRHNEKELLHPDMVGGDEKEPYAKLAQNVAMGKSNDSEIPIGHKQRLQQDDVELLAGGGRNSDTNSGSSSSFGNSDDVTMIDDEADYSGVDTKPSGLYSEGVSGGTEMDGWNLDVNNDVVDDYANLELLDDTSRQNRKNLLKGRDVVTKFLQIVETQHLLGANCTAGTDLNLGEGVVDRYAHDRFRVEAEIAVNRANMLTR